MTKARPCENAAFLCPVRMRTRFAHAWGVFTLSFVLAKSLAPCVAAVPPVAPVKVKFIFDPEKDAAFAFNVRLPRWCRNPEVTVNGTRFPGKCRPGRMLAIPRVWRKGDVVELDFPMEVRTVRGRKRQSGRFAVMRGPVVYALDTRKVDAFKDWAPYDVQTEMSMDPKQVVFENGKVLAVISTQHGALGVANFKADGCNPGDLRRVELLPFADEDCTLTYFRAPDIEEDVTDEDELFGPHSAGERAGAKVFNK